MISVHATQKRNDLIYVALPRWPRKVQLVLYKSICCVPLSMALIVLKLRQCKNDFMGHVPSKDIHEVFK